MKKFIIGCVVLMLSSPLIAQCLGTDSMRTCYDANGNSYQVNKIGNTTSVYGSGTDGSSWSQHSTTVGSTTYHDGTAANGNSWNSTQTQLGGGIQSWSGTDSRGESFNCMSGTYFSNCD